MVNSFKQCFVDFIIVKGVHVLDYICKKDSVIPHLSEMTSIKFLSVLALFVYTNIYFSVNYF